MRCALLLALLPATMALSLGGAQVSEAMKEAELLKSCDYSEKYQDQLAHAKQQQEIAESALAMQQLQVHRMQEHSKKDECEVELKDQLSGKNSKGDCVKGETYGCAGPRTMYVSDGCRGTFTCNGGHEKCESFSYKYEECRCKEASLIEIAAEDQTSAEQLEKKVEFLAKQ